jgi:hypothetical protein
MGIFVSVLGTIALVGCNVLPERESLIDGETLRARLEQVLVLELAESPKVTATATLVDVEATYYGESANETITVIVFRNPAADKQVLGGKTHETEMLMRIYRSRNVVIFYRVRPGTLGRGKAIESVLRSLAN